MKAKVLIPSLLAAAGLCGLTACDVRQTEEGEMPEVDVKGGNLPEYDVDAPDIDIGTEEKTITVPTIDIDSAAEDEAEEGGEGGTEPENAEDDPATPDPLDDPLDPVDPIDPIDPDETPDN